MPGVYQIGLAWSNVYLLIDENIDENDEQRKPGSEAALIDTGLQKDRPMLLAALSQLDIRPEQIRTVFLTHAHTDHAGNVAYFAALGADIAMHSDEARYLTPPRTTYCPQGISKLMRPLNTVIFTGSEALYPVERCAVTQRLSDGDFVEAPCGALRVIATPGHTPGQVAYYRERDGLLFSGDAILNVIPIRQKNGLSLPPVFLNSIPAQVVPSAKRLVELQPNLLCSGHGWTLRDRTAERLEEWITEKMNGQETGAE